MSGFIVKIIPHFDANAFNNVPDSFLSIDKK